MSSCNVQSSNVVWLCVCVVFSSLTDVSAGYSPSILDAMRLALHTSKAVWFKKGGDNEYAPLSHHEALYLATVGGAQGEFLWPCSPLPICLLPLRIHVTMFCFFFQYWDLMIR